MRGDSRFRGAMAQRTCRVAVLIRAHDQARVLDAAWPENTTDERRDEERDWVGSDPLRWRQTPSTAQADSG